MPILKKFHHLQEIVVFALQVWNEVGYSAHFENFHNTVILVTSI